MSFWAKNIQLWVWAGLGSALVFANANTSFAGPSAVAAGQPRAAAERVPAPAPPTPRRFVNSEQDFLLHTELHIRRVGRIGLAIRNRHPELYSDVDESLLRDFLAQHDGNKERLIGELYRFYGIRKEHMSPELRTEFNRVQGELNRSDDAADTLFFRRRGLLKPDGTPSETALKLKSIARVADQVDRYRCPVSEEEFAKKMEAGSTSVWLKDLTEKEIAGEFENPEVYFPLTADLDYQIHQKIVGIRGCVIRQFLINGRIGLPRIR